MNDTKISEEIFDGMFEVLFCLLLVSSDEYEDMFSATYNRNPWERYAPEERYAETK